MKSIFKQKSKKVPSGMTPFLQPTDFVRDIERGNTKVNLCNEDEKMQKINL